MAYIFLFEVIVDDLNLFSDVRNLTTADQDELGTARRELCVRLQLANLVRCEVCEKDFGSALDVEVRKTGENCLFAYNPTSAIELEEELVLRISAHEKDPNGMKQIIGSWKGPGREMLVGLAQAYDLQNEAPVEQSSKESLHSGEVDHVTQRNNKPVSHTFKTMYPLETETESTVVGMVVLTIRMSCLGPNINQKVLFGGRDLQQQPVTCYKMENEPVVQCVTLEDQDEQELICPKGSLASIVGTEIVPEVQPYDEYAAELNENAISIRVERDANIAVSIDGEESNECTKGCWTSLTLPDGVYGLKEEYIRQEANGCRLPVIRGTLKYPAYHWSGDFMLAKTTTPVTVEDYRKKPDPTRTVALQARPEQHERDCAGIEICRKGWHDPNVDVFVLKLGKNKRHPAGSNPRNEVEIELRTPRGPSQEIRPKVSRGMQVIEEEFEPAGEMPRTAAPTGEGEKADKKAKPAGKKGKKK
ncbi:uncharacterized protein LOC128299777 [Anopheles moucheti]|uniref:uncharacterized protein LOC128299777 n=1 Tax=Anopheles moucheti TaxID=186751 RepID=UPI0022F031CC|nr:uncharacterized protein LOC128299777 [Anopheles moucheti]